MPKQNEDASEGLTIADLLAGARLLLLPLALTAGLVLASRMFHDTSPPREIPRSFASVPQEAWLWAIIGYLAAVLPRQPLSLRVPGIPLFAKAAVWIIAATGFWLDLRFHDTLAPLLGTVLALLVAAGCILTTGFLVRTERLGRDEAAEAKSRMLEQMILECERLNKQQTADATAIHPALFAELSGILRSESPLGTTIWFLRPHPALDHRRPIDVMSERGGEYKLLCACKLGPNT